LLGVCVDGAGASVFRSGYACGDVGCALWSGCAIAARQKALFLWLLTMRLRAAAPPTGSVMPPGAEY